MLVRLPRPVARQVWGSITDSFGRYNLSTYYVPGFVPDSRDTAVNKTDRGPAFLKHMHSSWGDTELYAQVKGQVSGESTGWTEEGLSQGRTAG